jgi:hypothetical protein
VSREPVLHPVYLIYLNFGTPLQGIEEQNDQ